MAQRPYNVGHSFARIDDEVRLFLAFSDKLMNTRRTRHDDNYGTKGSASMSLDRRTKHVDILARSQERRGRPCSASHDVDVLRPEGAAYALFH